MTIQKIAKINVADRSTKRQSEWEKNEGGKLNTLDLDEVKALGAPFEKAEIHVSLRNKTVTLLLLVPGFKDNHPALNFHLDGNEDWQQVGRELTFAAAKSGLLDTKSIVAILNLDSGLVH